MEQTAAGAGAARRRLFAKTREKYIEAFERLTGKTFARLMHGTHI